MIWARPHEERDYVCAGRLCVCYEHMHLVCCDPSELSRGVDCV